MISKFKLFLLISTSLIKNIVEGIHKKILKIKGIDCYYTCQTCFSSYYNGCSSCPATR